MTLELTEEEANYIYNILQSGLHIPSDQEQDEFTFNLKRKFIVRP